jgi:RNA polymerase sigma-70 factor (ECF subfamily)
MTVRSQDMSFDAIEDAETALLAHIRAYERPIIRYLEVLLGDEDLALDCAQDTFLRAYHHLLRGRPLSPAWLYTVARNRAMDEFRRRKPLRSGDEAMERIPADGEQAAHDAAVRRVMASMRTEDREILYLHTVDRFTTEEIATMLHIRPGAARMRLMRARDRFRELWEMR